MTGIITQNIDALHQLAGSENIAEVHGSYWTASCLGCDRFTVEGASVDWWEKQIQSSPRSPVVVCPECGGVVKPGVVFYNEPVRDLDKSGQMVGYCDLLLVLGSSLTVYPAALLPQMTASPVIIVNQGDVALSANSDRYFVNEDLDLFFKKVAECIAS